MKSVRVLFSVGLAFCLLVVGGFVAVSASAHTPNVQADCDQLSVKLTSYNGGGANSVKVTINGDLVDDSPDFGSSYNETFDAPDQYASYDYVVEVKAHDDPDGTKGWTDTFKGSSTACTPPANGHTPVNVCHATSSDSNPFTFITVDDDSVKLKGHLMHRDQPNKTWKSDGVFLGKPVKAGDPKPDRIGDYTDSHGVLHTYDGVITSKSQCGILTPPVAPDGTFTQDCSPTGATVTIGDLSSGSATNVVWTLMYGNKSEPVTSGDKVAVPSGVALALSYTAAGNKSGTVRTDTSKPACPVAPTGSFTQNCTSTGASVTIGALNSGTAHNVVWTLHYGQAWQIVHAGDVVAMDSGLALSLTYAGDGDVKGTADSGTSTEACPTPVAPTGTFTQHCTADGATVTIGDLSSGTKKGVVWTLTYGDSSTPVESGDHVAVPSGAALALSWAAADESRGKVQQETAVTACPPVVVPPSGNLLAPTCTATGALVDVGPLSTGTSTGGTFRLTVNGVAQAVTSGQQDIVVPAGATLVLAYVPAEGPAVTLDSKTAPTACPPPVVPPVGTRDLTVTKAVSPTGAAKFGDTLTYTLSVNALGTLPQSAVTVTDKIPAGTSYVVGSAACPGGCSSVTVASGTVTWVIGAMAAGTTRNVSFAVTIDTPAAAAGGAIPAVTITNSGAVGSTELAPRDSNQVVTPVEAVEAVKISKPAAAPTTAVESSSLPHTGATLPIGVTTGIALLLLTLGGTLVSAPRLAQAVARRR